jgi:hypothetical protein
LELKQKTRDGSNKLDPIARARTVLKDMKESNNGGFLKKLELEKKSDIKNNPS